MKNKTELKQTKRLLKELGIYSEFIRERRKHLRRCYGNAMSSVFNVIFLPNDGLCGLLYFSFTWSKTENPLLWETLYNKLAEYGMMSNGAILNDNEIMKKLKKIVKNTQNG